MQELNCLNNKKVHVSIIHLIERVLILLSPCSPIDSGPSQDILFLRTDEGILPHFEEPGGSLDLALVC